MNYNELYQSLNSAVNYFTCEVSFSEVIKLLDTLKEKAINESAKEAGDSVRLKYAKKVLATNKKTLRQVLTKAIIRNEMQVFTDSYIGFRLSNHITGLETHEDENIVNNYPLLEKIIQRLLDDARFEMTLNILELKNKLAIIDKDGHIDFDLSDIEKVRFQKKNLETFIYTLGYTKNTDNITLKYKHGISAFYAVENNGSGDGIILPIRIDEE